MVLCRRIIFETFVFDLHLDVKWSLWKQSWHNLFAFIVLSFSKSFMALTLVNSMFFYTKYTFAFKRFAFFLWADSCCMYTCVLITFLPCFEWCWFFLGSVGGKYGSVDASILSCNQASISTSVDSPMRLKLKQCSPHLE